MQLTSVALQLLMITRMCLFYQGTRTVMAIFSVWFVSCSYSWMMSFPFLLWSSEDDTFLLYATLRSGKHCKFVTRDFLRDHKACLSDSTTRHLFRKWQRGHQIAFSSSVEGKHINFLVSFLLQWESTKSMFIKDTQTVEAKDSCSNLRNRFVLTGLELSGLLKIQCIHKACHKLENVQNPQQILPRYLKHK